MRHSNCFVSERRAVIMQPMFRSMATANPDKRPLTVADVNRSARALVESAFRSLSVEAEVVEVTHHRSGHVYFTLTDPGRSASLKAVMWRSAAARYGGRIQEGRALRCEGKLTVYEARGSFQMVVERVDEAGAGLKARLLAELREKLAAEGLFALERKRPLPPIPSCVGIVTSRGGAALRDIIAVSSRRFPVRLVLAHAAVQGESAPTDIVAALARLCALPEVEVIIVGRGGGSTEDLDAFNDERVVRAVASCHKPVVSAVGHEVDITLVDLAADRRAATPSEAAELVVADGVALGRRLAEMSKRLGLSTRALVFARQKDMSRIEARLGRRDPRLALREGGASLAKLKEALLAWPAAALAQERDLLSHREARLLRWPEPTLERAKGRYARLAAELDALSPLASLGRGYAIARRTSDNAILRSAKDARTGTRVDLTLAHGHLLCDVVESLFASVDDFEKPRDSSC
ncbi:MAG: exodeoxyribonuclease VII large subunit [Myxococcota bacterium]|nr:exodeoxyribonuclease VII large subunit [Myxococcota bacterium]